MEIILKYKKQMKNQPTQIIQHQTFLMKPKVEICFT